MAAKVGGGLGLLRGRLDDEAQALQARRREAELGHQLEAGGVLGLRRRQTDVRRHDGRLDALFVPPLRNRERPQSRPPVDLLLRRLGERPLRRGEGTARQPEATSTTRADCACERSGGLTRLRESGSHLQTSGRPRCAVVQTARVAERSGFPRSRIGRSSVVELPDSASIDLCAPFLTRRTYPRGVAGSAEGVFCRLLSPSGLTSARPRGSGR